MQPVGHDVGLSTAIRVWQSLSTFLALRSRTVARPRFQKEAHLISLIRICHPQQCQVRLQAIRVGKRRRRLTHEQGSYLIITAMPDTQMQVQMSAVVLVLLS